MNLRSMNNSLDDQFPEVKTPSLQIADEYTILEGKKIPVVRPGEMKDEPEPAIHHHNDLDQPSINVESDIVGIIQHSDLGGVTADQHHAQTHAASHTSGGADDLTGITLTSVTISGGTANSTTLVTPTLANYTNATHTHTSAATGGTLAPGGVTSIIAGSHLTGGTITSAGTISLAGTLTSINLVTPTVGTPTITGGTATGFDNIFTYDGTITRGTSGLMGTIAMTGHRTLVITRGTTDLISSITDSVRTWTYTRDASDYIISWAVT